MNSALLRREIEVLLGLSGAQLLVLLRSVSVDPNPNPKPAPAGSIPIPYPNVAVSTAGVPRTGAAYPPGIWSALGLILIQPNASSCARMRCCDMISTYNSPAIKATSHLHE